jgi:uracil-DNA glycosylase
MTVDKRVAEQRTLDDGQVVLKKAKSIQITDFFASKSTSESKTTKLVTNTAVETSGRILQTEVTKPFSTNDLSDYKREYIKTLTEDQIELLWLEINFLEDSWFEKLHEELTKPYFIQLKTFLNNQLRNKVTIFPPQRDIYSWSTLTPLHNVKIIILGQDPYHNVNQAHGLAFSVKSPTKPPPSLKNIYKGLKIDYPDFEIPKDKGDLTQWAKQGVLMLNACLTVKAHEANSHSKKGWEQFTEVVLRVALENTEDKKVLLLWGTPAQKRFESLKLKIKSQDLLVLKSVHPSPLSARRGFFEAGHFKKANDWLIERNVEPVDWNLL